MIERRSAFVTAAFVNVPVFAVAAVMIPTGSVDPVPAITGLN